MTSEAGHTSRQIRRSTARANTCACSGFREPSTTSAEVIAIDSMLIARKTVWAGSR